VERDDGSFDIDDEFVVASEDEPDYDRLMERADRRARTANPAAAIKKGRAAWSKLEDVLAEKRLQKQLLDFDEDN
jgi:hypothetical protein